MFLGLINPVANLVTAKPSGAAGALSFGQPITLQKFPTDLVAYGLGRFTAPVAAPPASPSGVRRRIWLSQLIERSARAICASSKQIARGPFRFFAMNLSRRDGE